MRVSSSYLLPSLHTHTHTLSHTRTHTHITHHTHTHTLSHMVAPDNPVITSSHENPVQEGTTVILNCTATITNPTYTWTKDDAALPAGNMFEVNPTYLRIVMATSDSSGRYMCRASNVNNDVLSEPYELEILPTPRK